MNAPTLAITPALISVLSFEDFLSAYRGYTERTGKALEVHTEKENFFTVEFDGKGGFTIDGTPADLTNLFEKIGESGMDSDWNLHASIFDPEIPNGAGDEENESEDDDLSELDSEFHPKLVKLLKEE